MRTRFSASDFQHLDGEVWQQGNIVKNALRGRITLMNLNNKSLQVSYNTKRNGTHWESGCLEN